MRVFSFLFVLFCSGFVLSQNIFDETLSKTMLAGLNNNDSLAYYQCRAKQAKVEITTANQQIESKEQSISITEKFTIVRKNNLYFIRYYTSGITALPNRKFSGLKMHEKDYWNFSFRSERTLTEKELIYLATLEKQGRETTEYDFTISKYTPNQIIIKQGKNFEQLLLKVDISISEALQL